ncbi:MAG: glycosyltransferase 87 family protein [Patescibacteria group bacterium]
MGAKYFGEVGYFDFYQCAIEAGGKTVGWSDETITRDLRTYNLLPSKDVPACHRERFSEARWLEYKNDVAWIIKEGDQQNHLPNLDLVTDKGFNPTPFWSVVAGDLANAFPSQKGLALTLLMMVDFLVFVFSIAFIRWKEGDTLAILTALLTLFYFGAFHSLGGQFLQYIWFLCIIVSTVLWRAKKPFSSGVLMGLAIGIRSFPLFFAAPMFCVAFYSLIKKQKNIPVIIFCAGCITAMLMCFIIGSTSTRGVSAWQEWSEKISVHEKYLRGEIFEIGLPNLISTIASEENGNASNYLEDFPHTLLRIARFEKFIFLYYALAGTLLALWAWLLWKNRSLEVFGYGFIPLYVLTSLSPIYYLSLALLPCMFGGAPIRIRNYAVGGTLLLMVAHLPFLLSGYITFNYYDHLISGILIFLFFIGMVYVWHKEESLAP